MKKPYSRTLIWAIAFLIYTIFVSVIDNRAVVIGDYSVKVGFAALNGWFFKTFGTSGFFEVISKLIGVLCIIVAALWCALFVLRFVQRKNIRRIEKYLVVFLAFLVVLGFLYVFFNVVKINVRPIPEADGTFEASYPSSHTLLILCITFVSSITLPRLIKDKSVLKIACPALRICGIVGVAARRLSGGHWL
ncbi:MAG: hypothetical protein IJV00_03630, partial [Clostridia bacterium]|nr:hypothetical protein [Clostridia bacterium]